MRRITPTIGVVVLLWLAGCASIYQREIKYDLGHITLLQGGGFSNGSLLVKRFEDARPLEERSRHASLGSVAVAQRAGDDWYCNSDDRYKGQGVASEVTEIIAKHIGASKLFRQASVESGLVEQPDYILSGQIEKFDACRQREAGREALVAQMGLIGLIIQATHEVPYDATTVLNNVRLIHAPTGAVLWTGRAEGRVEGKERIDPYGWTVFEHANDSVKLAVAHLSEQLAGVQQAGGVSQR